MRYTNSHPTENKQERTPIVEALKFAKLGWAVIPIHFVNENRCSCGNKSCSSVAKHPLTRNGSKDGSKDIATICNWWTKWPKANIGIVTGKSSGLFVIDVDPRHGGDRSWKQWSTDHKIPKTAMVNSGGGGYHLYFKSSSDMEILPNRANILQGVDCRGQGGYIIAPGSLHASGIPYLWSEDTGPDSLTKAPTSILELATKKIKVEKQQGSKATIPGGSRNTTLASLAGSLKRRGILNDALENALSSINQDLCNPPLPQKEIVSISRSISSYKDGLMAWDKVKDIPDYQAKTPFMDKSFLPEAISSWISDISDRMQVPLEFIAIPALVSISSVIGRQIGIYPKKKDDWLVIPNMWGAVVARPGFFKSPAIAEALKPLETLTQKAHTKFKAELVTSQAKESVVKSRIDGLKDRIKKAAKQGNDHEIEHLQADIEAAYLELEQTKVTEKRYKTNDATIEKLACLLNENPSGLLMFRDELSGWLSSMQKVGRECDRDFYLEAWNGYGSYCVDRIGRGTIHVETVCLSILGGIQPGRLDSYVTQALAGGKGDDGLLQRFQLLVYPETSKTWKNIDRRPDRESFERVAETFVRLSEIRSTWSIPSDLKGIHFDSSAQRIFDNWREQLENRLRSDSLSCAAFESHLAKYRSLVPSLALIFYLLSYSNDKRDGILEVDSKSLHLAIKWAKFLESHALKIYEKASNPEISGARILADRIKDGRVKDQDSLRSIYRRNWSQLNSLEKLENAIGILDECNWVKTESVRSGSKMVDRIRINPSLTTSS